ncbi:MAG TPA: tetratricopeptide repeat protein [Burkholderiales bacterium]|nr:tetratricopeptide repeat protein [Burkholderiales bacterium]
MNKSLYALLPAVVLAACAQAPNRPGSVAAVSSDPPPPAARAARTPAAPEAPLPKVDLTPEMLYDLMAAEIANQRGASSVAYAKFIELAERTRDPRLARRAAEIAAEDRDDEKALRALKLWVQTDPSNAEARLNLARLLLATGHGDEAGPHLEKLLAGGEVSVTDVFSQINRLLSRDPDRKATLITIQRLAAKYPGVPEARLAVARAAAAAGEDGLAISEARAAASLKPDWELPVLMSSALLAKRSAAEASLELKKFIDANPKSLEARLAYARSLYAEKKYPEATAEFHAIERSSPDNPDVLFPLALLALDAKDYGNAETYLKKLLDTDVRDRNPVFLYLGQAAEEQKKYAQARQWWGQIGRGEQYFPAQARIAESFAKEGKMDEARTFLHGVATTNNQQRVQMVLAEAQILREANLNREAFDLLEKNLEKLPNNPDLLYESAMTAEKLSKLDVQETQLKKLIQLKPDYAHAYNALGYSLADRNERLGEARDLIEKALKIAPDDAAIIDSMGWVLYRLGDMKRAIDLLQRAYEARPDPEIAAHLGEVLWQSNRKPEAQRVWREARAKAPADEILLTTMKRFKQ